MRCSVCTHDTETCDNLKCGHYGHGEGHPRCRPMTADLRTRIIAHRESLLVEREVAEAAWITDEDALDRFVARLSAFGEQAIDHIATQNPAHTIARIDRELVAIDADLALLDACEYDLTDMANIAESNLSWRYPA